MAMFRLIPLRGFALTSTTVFLVRHADIDPMTSETPVLNAAGQTRAGELVHVLESVGIDEIMVSQALRTQQTAVPLATHLGLTPIVMSSVDDIVQRIRTQHLGGKVLVVGHSDTVPQIIDRFGGGQVSVITTTEFDRLFVLVLSVWRRTRLSRFSVVDIIFPERWAAMLLKMQYGAST